MSSVSAELTIFGHVQGVGFRYFCYRTAVGLNLTGWVANNPDGSVSTLVEGERGTIEEYVKELKAGPAPASVRDIKLQWGNFSGKYHSFEITH